MDRTASTACMIFSYMYFQIKKYIHIVCWPACCSSASSTHHSCHLITLDGSQ